MTQPEPIGGVALPEPERLDSAPPAPAQTSDAPAQTSYRRRLVLVIGVFALLGWGFFGRSPMQQAAFDPTALDPPIAIGDIGFRDRLGNRLTLDRYAGMPVVLNLWATWCQPCLEELPSLNAMQRKLGGEGLQVVTIELDESDAGAVRATLNRVGARDLPEFRDLDDEVVRRLGAGAIPRTFLVNRNGEAVFRLVGAYDWASGDVIEAVRDRLLRANRDATQ